MCIGICESVWLVVRVPGFWGGCVWVCGCTSDFCALFYGEVHPKFLCKIKYRQASRVFFSKLCIKVSAACVFTKKCTPYFSVKLHTADHLEVF